MGKWYRGLLGVLTLALGGCISQGQVYQAGESAEGPRVVALSGARAPWIFEIDRRLRGQGFKVLRWSSRTRVTEVTAPGRTEEYNEAEARYVLHVDGYARTDPMHRCFGGGYQFDYLNAELIDVQTNETMMHVSGRGFSEGCPPMSGTIFQDIADAVGNSWGGSR
jgi:hypothetical protein